MKRPPLWTCPKCGERFTGRNMSHSCGKFSLDDLFARSEPEVFRLFRGFAQMVRACGPLHMIPQRTRVVFQARMRFIAVMPRKKYLLCHFILPRRLASERFHKIETFRPRCHAHYLRLIEAAGLDREMARWMEEAYEVGRQLHLVSARLERTGATSRANPRGD